MSGYEARRSVGHASDHFGDRHAEFWAFLCVTVPETRPKHQKARPSRRISGKKLRDGIQTQEAEGEKGTVTQF